MVKRLRTSLTKATIGMGGLLLATGLVGAEPSSPLLKSQYADAFMMGTAVNDQIVTGQDNQAQNIVLRHFNTLTIENDMKAGPINPNPGEFNFAPADRFVEFGLKHDMFILGHTLVWHNQTPDWVFKRPDGTPNTPKQQLEVMRKHIEVVAGRYAGKVDAWDVVNEVIADDGSYRPTTWVKSIGSGDEMVRAAFSYAQKYAPNAELYYNDFNAWRPEKVKGIVRMVKMLKAHSIRIDGVGIQAHWGLNFPSDEHIENAIDAYAAAGVKVMISELDIDVLPLTREGQIIGTGMLHPQFELEEFETYLDPYQNGLPTDVQEKLTARYQGLFELFYKKRDVIDRVTFWGVNDTMSWKNYYPIANRVNYPLLWNRDYTAKPALEAIINVVKEK